MVEQKHKFPYRWTLRDAVFTNDKGTVFSCFSGGGGSSMGYKMAGFDVIGCNEIDPRMMKVYKNNLHPKYSFLNPIQEFKERGELPKELYELDILDGSPPCSSFTMAGLRSKAWGETKKFREGQTEQVLDTLFFDFIDVAERLRPKVVIAENVKGLLLGDAIKYVREIYERFDRAGYYCQHWLLDASVMGVPQKRERVFFICLRKDLADQFLYQANMFDILPKINMDFSEPIIPFSEIMTMDQGHANGVLRKIWGITAKGENPPGNSYFSYVKGHENKPLPTIVGGGKNVTVTIMHPTIERFLNNEEVILGSSFPTDYDFSGQRAGYVCSMCVPPVMIAQIALRVYEEWLSKI